MGSIVLVRHGETEWSVSGRHTSHTDIDLTDSGRDRARGLASALATWTFARVLSSPWARARETARLAGFAEPEVVDDLREWDYGRYEGRTTDEIRGERPDWTLWGDGVPDGESLGDVAVRADRVIASCTEMPGDVALFGHGHLLRVLAARWVGLDGAGGRLLALDAASVSVLGHEREQAVIRLWNARG
jgi:broad specificity phosphatase PhoE